MGVINPNHLCDWVGECARPKRVDGVTCVYFGKLAPGTDEQLGLNWQIHSFLFWPRGQKHFYIIGLCTEGLLYPFQRIVKFVSLEKKIKNIKGNSSIALNIHKQYQQECQTKNHERQTKSPAFCLILVSAPPPN